MKTNEIIILVFAVLLIVIGPLATLWALNTLFPVLAIEYTFSTWLASFILSGAMGAGLKSIAGK